MIQFNLCNNDVIIILIIFFVFCIFLYMNNKNEHFTISTNYVKKQYKKTLSTFFKHFTTHIGDLQNLIDEEKELINSINNNDTSIIINNINSIKDKYDTLLKTLNKKIELDENIEISTYLNKLMSYIKNLLTEHSNLFIDENSDELSTKKLLAEYTKICIKDDNIGEDWVDSINFCGTIIHTNKIFYKILPYKLEVIENNNISQLLLIKYNLKEIIDIINKQSFEDDYKLKLLNIFKEYYEVLDLMFNKNSVNIFNKINEKIENCKPSETTAATSPSTTTPTDYSIVKFEVPTEVTLAPKTTAAPTSTATQESTNTTAAPTSTAIQESTKTTAAPTTEAFTSIIEHFGEDDRAQKMLNIISDKLTQLSKDSDHIKFESKSSSIDKIFKMKDSAKDHFIKTKANLKLEQQFCKKLKELNKPNKKNVVFKRFRNDLIDQKKKYIKKLEENIYTIQQNMSTKELYDYDINKLRTHDQASKQYKAIIKGIDNIKNRNQVKINLT